MEFIRLPSKIINLSQIRSLNFKGCETTIHWCNGDAEAMLDIDAAVLLSALEQNWGLLTDECARWWEEPVEDSNHITRSHFQGTLPTTTLGE